MTSMTGLPTAARWRAVLWGLIGLWIVAHGCHADRDTELFGGRRHVTAARSR
jgi:hypothetical protein